GLPAGPGRAPRDLGAPPRRDPGPGRGRGGRHAGTAWCLGLVGHGAGSRSRRSAGYSARTALRPTLRRLWPRPQVPVAIEPVVPPLARAIRRRRIARDAG